MKFTFERYKNHIMAEIDGKVCLIDTGSPATFGTGMLPSFGNPIGKGLRDVSVEKLRSLLGRQFDILLGTDILGRHRFVVDWGAQTITFDSTNRLAGTDIPLDNIEGCPLIAARVDGQDVKLAVDTGSKVTFLKPSLVAGATAKGWDEDFYITFGAFSYDTFEKTVGIGDATLDLTVGELPLEIAIPLAAVGIDGVLGNDILDDYPKVLYDLQNGVLTLGR